MLPAGRLGRPAPASLGAGALPPGPGGGRPGAAAAAARAKKAARKAGGAAPRAPRAPAGAGAAAPVDRAARRADVIAELQAVMDLDAVRGIEITDSRVVLTLDSPGGAGAGSDSDDEDGPGAAAPREARNPALRSVMDAVVKVYAFHTEPNYSLPWQRKSQYASTSSGFVISADAAEGGRRWLLTNAHSVEHHTQVKVKRRGDDRKFLARVLAVGTECDVALLAVDDPEFWAGVAPVAFGGLPHLQDDVHVVGYPIGGDTISVTSGVVSRIEVTAYAHGATDLLGVQIDAAINSGNSGGPAFTSAGACVGIAFQSYAGSDAENIGYVIPVPVIEHFLQDYERSGGFTGFPALGLQWQRMESGALRAACGLPPGARGVLVRRVHPCSHAAGALVPGDVLQRFDGVEVACDGTVPFRSGERIAFSYLTSQKFVGDVCTLDVLRGGEPLTVDVELMRPDALVPRHLAGADPAFLVVAGLVFTPASEPYLESEYGADYGREAPVKLLDRLLHGQKATPDEAVVVVSQVLACEATLGYEDVFNTQVRAFNGAPVRNLRHLAELVLACTETFMTFELEYHELIVLDAATAAAATAEVLGVHSIPAMASRDMGDLLAGAGGAWAAAGLAALPPLPGAAAAAGAPDGEPLDVVAA